MDRLEGINPELLRRYLEARQRIDTEANSIFAITSMLALMVRCGDDKIEVVHVALGKINQLLNTHILNIWEILDGFIYLVRARAVLEE